MCSRRATFDLIFVGAALINAVGWSWDLFNQPGLYVVPRLSDTVTDLILDSAGALLAAMLCLWGINERAQQEKRSAAGYE